MNFKFTIDENMICKIECSEFYNRMLETGETDFLLNLFNQAISILSQNLRKNNHTTEELSDKEKEILNLVFSLIEE